MLVYLVSLEISFQNERFSFSKQVKNELQQNKSASWLKNNKISYKVVQYIQSNTIQYIYIIYLIQYNIYNQMFSVDQI